MVVSMYIVVRTDSGWLAFDQTSGLCN